MIHVRILSSFRRNSANIMKLIADFVIISMELYITEAYLI